MMGRLTDKVAVITGGTSGIGLSSVELFVEEGARVVVGEVREGPGAALQDRYPSRVLYVHTDVTDDAAVGRLVQSSVSHFGKLDVIFNNAGAVGDTSPLEELGAEGLDRTLKLLVQSVVLGHKYATRQFRNQVT